MDFAVAMLDYENVPWTEYMHFVIQWNTWNLGYLGILEQ